MPELINVRIDLLSQNINIIHGIRNNKINYKTTHSKNDLTFKLNKVLIEIRDIFIKKFGNKLRAFKIVVFYLLASIFKRL